MTVRVAERRQHKRFSFPAGFTATFEFEHESFDGGRIAMRLRDVSGAGISFRLERDVDGLDVGDSLDGAILRLGESVIPGDLLVMRLTPDASEGSTCGGLFFPHSDDGIRALQRFLIDAAGAPSSC